MKTLVVDKSMLTAEVYLKAETQRKRGDKYEYHNGQLIGVGGASKEHNRLSLNLSGLLWQAFLEKPYEVFHSDMRTYAPETNSYFYPDLVICREEAQFKDDEFDNLTNPALVVETRSPATSAKDRGGEI